MAVATPNLPRHFQETRKEVHAFISIIKRKCSVTGAYGGRIQYTEGVRTLTFSARVFTGCFLN